MVIIGAKGRLAVECDGDFWHGPAAYESDLARQRELERCGWEFFRIRESLFYADMPGSLDKLWKTLNELDIRTADWIDPNFDEDEVEEVGEESLDDEGTTEVVDESNEVDEPADYDGTTADVDDTPDDMYVDPELFGDLIGLPAHASGSLFADDPMVPERGDLQPYMAFDEPLPNIADSRLDTVTTNIARIVAVEGPVLGERLHQAYAKAAGGQVVGKKIAQILNQAITSAERRGMIVSDNPLGEAGVKPKTFRLATQPQVVARELGPRSLAQVPPAELAHHLEELVGESQGRTNDELFKMILRRLGLERLTEPAKSVLMRAMMIVPLQSGTTERDASLTIS